MISFAIAPVVLLIVHLLKRRSGGAIANESTVSVRPVKSPARASTLVKAAMTTKPLPSPRMGASPQASTVVVGVGVVVVVVDDSFNDDNNDDVAAGGDDDNDDDDENGSFHRALPIVKLKSLK